MDQQKNIPTIIKRRIHSMDRVINNMLPNMYPCDYYSAEHFIVGLLEEIRWFLIDNEELRNIERKSIEDYIQEYKYDELTEYYNEQCMESKDNNIQESIRRILRENSLKNDLMGLINNVGVKKASKAVGGFKNLFRILNINSPMDYLHLFDDLKIIPLSETEFRDGFFNDPDVDCYGYNPDKIIFIHFKDREGEGRISYEEIWEILREEFGLTYDETRELTMEWLNSVFDLQVSNTFDDGY
jgi:hypothetical protein